MRSPAAAIAWEFRQRHRWGWIAVGGYLLVLTAIRLVIGGRVTFDDAQSFALAVVVPITSTFLYFLAVFSFGLAGDIAARRSIYPARMFTLPVSTAALAGWPMLYGTAAMAVLWLATRFLAVWPSGFDIPVMWPALLAASLLAWTQALTWMAYPLRGLRVIVTVLWLSAIDAIVMVALEFKPSEAVMLAILAPHVPLAYLAARFAVARARRGDVPDWQRVFARVGVASVLSRRKNDFSSPARAQAWFEWRRHGRALPAMVALVLPFELGLLFLFSDTPVIVFGTLAGALLTPPFLAVFAAATMSDSSSLTPFLATRPLTNAAIITAKLEMTIRSTLAAWLLLVIVIPLAVRFSGTTTMVADWTRELVDAAGKPRAIAIVLLGFAALVGSTWKQLVQSFYIGLSGRAWLIKGSVFVALSLLAVSLPLAQWIFASKRVMAALWTAIPSILAVLVCLKLSAAAWIAMRLHDARLLSERSLIVGAMGWDVAVFALYGLLAWLLPSVLFRSSSLALVAILAVPLARLSAAPLALARNRHR